MRDLASSRPIAAQTIEMSAIPDTFANNIVAIDKIGSCFRLIFTVPTALPQDGDRTEHMVVAKLVIPAEALPAILQALARAQASPLDIDLIGAQTATTAVN